MIELPAGLELARTTPDFNEETVPPGLVASHQVAEGVWGRLVVLSGSLTFRFEDDLEPERLLRAGENQVIPPVRPHRLEMHGPVTFHVEFHRPLAADEHD